jgi:phosphoglycerate dehydrogenase-like enzyme
VRIVTAVHDTPVWTLPVSYVQALAERFPDSEIVDARTPEERLREIPAADVLLATRISRDEARAAARLKWIQSTAVGVGGLMIPEVIARGIMVTNVRGVHSEAIAEHALGLVLALRRGLHVAAARQAAREWAQLELRARHMPEVRDSRVIVIGLGAIGSRVARMAAGCGFRVTGVRRRLDRPVPEGVERVIGLSDLLTHLPAADVVVLATPTTRETRAMIGARELAAMRPTAVLVNVARGRLIDDAALVSALKQGQIAGAGLDAFEQEPLPSDHPLWAMPNVLITPHTAAFGGDYWAAAIDLFVDNMSRFRRGEPLRNLVDTTLGY